MSSDQPAAEPPAPAWIGEAGVGRSRDARLLARAVREQWPIDDKTRSAIVAQTSINVLTQNPAAAPTVYRAATDAILRMIDQNLKQEELEIARLVAEKDSGILGTTPQIQLFGQNIVLVEDENFYGNAAHHQNAKALAEPIANAPEPGEVQGVRVREAVRENGVRPTNGAARPRGDEGPEAGGP